MRRALLAIAALALFGPAQGLGGLAVHGAGFGTYASNDGARVCPDSPFVVEALYLPDGHGAVHAEFAGSCLGTAGMVASCCGVRVATDPALAVEVTMYCTGAEAAGLRCEALVNNVLLTVDVGAYAGPASTVTFASRGAFRFDGAFTAA